MRFTETVSAVRLNLSIRPEGKIPRQVGELDSAAVPSGAEFGEDNQHGRSGPPPEV